VSISFVGRNLRPCLVSGTIYESGPSTGLADGLANWRFGIVF
jgi:hypothetical protein